MIHSMDPLLFRKRYRIPSARKPGRDYAAPGRYFVTIVTRHRLPWFGDIRHGVMGLSDAGCVAWDCWDQIPRHYPNVSTGAFIVMPDHVHGIITIGPGIDTMWPVGTSPVETWPVETRHAASLPMDPQPVPRLATGSLGAIINQYKSACSKYIHQLGYGEFQWQSRFHDRIIRSGDEYDRIAAYIRANPLQEHRS